MVSTSAFIRFVCRFLRHQRGRFSVITILDALAWPLDSLIWPYILGVLVDVFTRHDMHRHAVWHDLIPPLVGLFILCIAVEAASRVMGYLMSKAIPKVQANMRMHMFDHIQQHSPNYFNHRFAGNLANKITDMTTQVDLFLQQLFWPIIPAISGCILGILFLWRVHPLFAWIGSVWVVAQSIICWALTRKVDVYEHTHGQVRSSLLGKVVDSFTNNFAVNLFYRFSYERMRLNRDQEQEEKANRAARMYIEKIQAVISVLYVAVLSVMFTFLVFLWLQNSITTGQVIQVINTFWALVFILWTVSRSLPILFQSMGIAKQAYSVLSEEQDLGDIEQPTELAVPRGEICFDRVFFHYGDNQLFVNKSVTIRGGEKVGLVGYTGAGKTTFINLILRMFPLHQGRILIDQQDIAEVSLKSLRRQIALIPQDPILFHRTLWENIGYSNPQATRDDIRRAARLAHCEEFIEKLPQKYETLVGERGTKLSGGEKQRIAIARAILADTPILILDEATSALDSATEELIRDSLAQLMQDRTTIVIAHRLSTLSQMDRLLIFDQGKIVEAGPHSSLLQEDGVYSKLWEMQAQGFLPKKR